MSRATEPFGRLPNRLAADVAAGELTPHGLLLLTYFALTSVYAPGREPCWTGTARRIEDELRWPHGRSHLLKELKRLRDGLYMLGGPRPRSRAPFQVRLLRARCDVTADSLRTGEAPTGRSDSEQSAVAGGREAAPRKASHDDATARSPQSQDKTKTKTQRATSFDLRVASDDDRTSGDEDRAPDDFYERMFPSLGKGDGGS